MRGITDPMASEALLRNHQPGRVNCSRSNTVCIFHEESGKMVSVRAVGKQELKVQDDGQLEIIMKQLFHIIDRPKRFGVGHEESNMPSSGYGIR